MIFLKKKMEIRIWQVLPNENKAKSKIRQVLLTNNKAKDMEGKSNLFGVRKLGRYTHPHVIAIIVTVHNHVARRVIFNIGSSRNIPYNNAMKKSMIT